MKIHNVEQGSVEWHQLRLGRPTASCFEKIITPSGQPSKQSSAYANQLIAEWLCGQPVDGYENDWMKRGTELEPDARAYYELFTDDEVRQVGFVTALDGAVGCSPDGLIGDHGLLEIKCPAPHTHVDYLIDGAVPKKYVPQIQGQMYVTGAKWCDFLSYHPQMPPVMIRVERDEKYIAAIGRELGELFALVEQRKRALIKRGIQPTKEAAAA